MNRPVSSGAGLIVTERDRDLLQHIYRFRLLPRDQAMELAGFQSLTRANTRLANLARAKLISRKKLPILPGHGSAQTLYYLGAKSTSVLDADPSIVTAQIRQISRWDTRQVEHVVAANATLIHFLLAIRRDPQVQLVSFRTEPELRCAFLGRPLVPDGWVAWIEHGKRFNIFLEIDLVTEGLTQWRQKVLDYLTYAESGFHQQLFDLRSFRVVVLVKTRKRLESLRKAAGHADRLFLFAELSAITPESFFDAAWLPVGGGQLIKLTEAR